MALEHLGPIIYGSHPSLLQYPKNKHLIACSATCRSCSPSMEWKIRANVKDGYTRRCKNSAYCKMLSICHDSFFEKSKVSLRTWLHTLYLWAVDTPNKTTVQARGISERVTVDAYNFICDVCSWKLLQTPIKLGGLGKIIQIDESLFKHKPKVSLIIIMCTYNISVKINVIKKMV